MGLVLWIGALSDIAAQSELSPIDSTIRIIVTQVEGPSSKRLKRRYNATTFKKKEARALGTALRTDFFAAGYVLFDIDSFQLNDSLQLKINPGPIYRWKELRFSDDVEGIMRKSGVNLSRFKRKSVSPVRIQNAMEKGLRTLENSGFPFASFQLDSLRLTENEVAAVLALDKGRFVKIDSVSIQGDLKVRESYLTNYLGVKEGAPYNEQAILQIPSKLQAIRFLRIVKPPEITFQDDLTKVALFLNRNNASSFDGVIGFLPDNATGDLLITGDVQLHLENALKQGEVLDLNWRKLQTNTQELNAEAISPYLLNTPVSLDAALKIYRRDTLFTDVFRQVGLRFVFGGGDYIRFFIDRQTTDLISTSQYESITVAPPYLDRAITSYGAGFQLMEFDNPYNPSKGFEIKTEAAVGNKEIIPNAGIPSVVYDSLELKTLQIKGRIDGSYAIRVVPRLIWFQRALGAALWNSQLFNNEAYRIGGLKTLRGFNEESIFATSYLIARSELRYQFDKDGYVFGFFDGAWYENRSLNRIGAARDVPYGTGVGLAFGTRAGVFSLSYALGSQQGNPIELRAAKIHFGFLSLF